MFVYLCGKSRLNFAFIISFLNSQNNINYVVIK